MSFNYGMKAIIPADAPHILGMASARTGATDLLLEVWNGASDAARVFGIQQDGQVFAQNGSAAAPVYTFEDDPDIGLYRVGVNRLGVGVDAAKVWEWGDGYALLPDNAQLKFGSGSDYLFIYNSALAQLEFWNSSELVFTVVDGSPTVTFTELAGTVPGSLLFGADVNLYRDSADVLKTDDSLTVAGTLVVAEIEAPIASALTITATTIIDGDLSLTGDIDFAGSVVLAGEAGSDGNAPGFDHRTEYGTSGTAPVNRFFTQPSSSGGPSETIGLQSFLYLDPTSLGRTKNSAIQGFAECGVGAVFSANAEVRAGEFITIGRGNVGNLPAKAVGARIETVCYVSTIAEMIGLEVWPAGYAGQSALWASATVGAANYGVVIHEAGATGTTLHLHDPGSSGYTITAESGAYLSYDGTWTDSSSRTKKDNIVDLNGEGLEALRELRPRMFDRILRKGEGPQDIGFIAEEVPDMVAQGDRRGVAAGRVATLAVLGWQNHDRRIEELERRLERMEA